MGMKYIVIPTLNVHIRSHTVILRGVCLYYGPRLLALWHTVQVALLGQTFACPAGYAATAK
jgi:hypothetical protein